MKRTQFVFQNEIFIYYRKLNEINNYKQKTL